MSSIENIIEFEKLAVERYQELADSCISHEGIRRILVNLTEDHKQHIESLTDIKNEPLGEAPETKVFKEVRVYFENLKNKKEPYTCSSDQLELYQEALTLIQQKLKLYEEAAENIEQDKVREVIQNIADDEQSHAVVLENIIAMVSRPDNWIENAEFTRLDEY